MTTALFLLRCKELHFTIDELDQLSTGAIEDCFIESGNDNADYKQLATQEDYDRF